MFEEVQDQFHQFLAGSTPQITASPNPLPLPPLSFSLLHGSSSSSSSLSSFPIFDPYPPPPPPTNHHQHHHHVLQQLGGVKQEREGESTSGFLSTSLVIERERSMAPDSTDPWSHDEVLALLRIRSAMENWFPEFTWEHVSRKLAEIGFKRSPQRCKEKFEESCPTKNYRLFSELEELYHHGHEPTPPPPSDHHHQQQNLIARDGCDDQNDVVFNKQNPEGKEQEQEQEEDDDDQEQLGEGEGQDKMGHERVLDDDDRMDEVKETKMGRKKRRSHHHMNNKKKLEVFKSFCEEIVSKMMAQQEELHNKILEDIIKRDEENFAREEAWKRQEIERLNKEIEARARDQAMVSDRQAKIIEFLKKFTTNNSTDTGFAPSSNTPIFSTHQNPSSSATPTSSNDESFSQTSKAPNPRKPRPTESKRWPRDEVLALINIRCSIDLANSTGPDSTNNGNKNTKNAPLWERISQRMTELGYKRSAKRCKEKWENINKYFRKTKDSHKKRSFDSRTCPYFHQLSHLYSQGRIMGGAGGGTGGVGGATTANAGGDQGEGNVVQVTTSTCDFEF